MAMKGGYKINGIPIMGEEMTTGSVFFVDSTTGLSGNSGLDALHPLSTVDLATNKCTANKGDIVYIMPNHAENIDANTDWVPDIAGVTYIGLGSGDDAPTFTYTGTSGEISIGADNITFKNLRFVAGIDAVTVGIDVNAHHFTMQNCEMIAGTTTTYDWVDMVDVSAYDWAKFDNCRFYAEEGTAGANTAIQFVDSNFIQIVNCQFYGDFAEAPIWNITTASSHILIDNNFIYNDDTDNADNCISLQAACTGIISNNLCGSLYSTNVTTLIDPGSCLNFNNFFCNAINEHAMILNPGNIST